MMPTTFRFLRAVLRGERFVPLSEVDDLIRGSNRWAGHCRDALRERDEARAEAKRNATALALALAQLATIRDTLRPLLDD